MQLVDRKKQSNQEESEPLLYAALIDSMCQNFWPIFFGSVCAAAGALMTARFVSYEEIAGQLDDAVNLILGASVA